MKILLVDDEDEILSILQDLFESHNHEVSIACSVETGLDALADDHFDLVITDLRMPKVNGQYFVELLHIKSPHLPILVLSGFVENEEELYNMGASKIFSKPVDFNELLDYVKNLK